MTNIVVRLVENLFELIGLVSEIALGDPLSALLVLTCIIIWTFTFGLGGYMTVGAVFSWIGARLPSDTRQSPAQ